MAKITTIMQVTRRVAEYLIEAFLFAPISAISAVTLIIMGILLTFRHTSEWNLGYVRSAQLLVHGGDIYKDLATNTYPPFSAFFFAPAVWLPDHLGRAIWFVICAASLIFLVKSSWRLAGGESIEPIERTKPAELAAWAVGNICVFQFALNALTHLQTDLLIACLLMLGVAAIANHRFARAAVWIGMAAAFKATPLLFAPYLAWRRQWRAAALMVLVAIAANVLPNTIPPPGGGIWLVRWYRLYLQPMAASTYTPGNWKNQLNNNQAFAGAANRWIQSSWQDNPKSGGGGKKIGWSPAWVLQYLQQRHPDWNANQVSVAASDQTVRALYFGLCILALMPLAWCLRQNRSDPPEGLEPGGRYILECGVVLCLMLLLSPNSSRAHFCILYLPAFCAARLAFRPGASTSLRLMLILAAVCSTLSIHIRLPFSYSSEQVLLWLGMVMWTAIFLMLACTIALAAPTSVQTDRNFIPALAHRLRLAH